MFALVHYPEVQEKAYRELMAVVGPSRVPSFADYDSLLYVRAVLKEILRVWPPTPIGELSLLFSLGLRLTWHAIGIPHHVTEVCTLYREGVMHLLNGHRMIGMRDISSRRGPLACRTSGRHTSSSRFVIYRHLGV